MKDDCWTDAESIVIVGSIEGEVVGILSLS